MRVTKLLFFFLARKWENIKIIHRQKYNEPFNTVISIDNKGVIEYWDPCTKQIPKTVKFQYKSDTSLYELAKNKVKAMSLDISNDGKYFGVIGSDRHIRLFSFLSGKLFREYNENLADYHESQKNPLYKFRIDDIDFGRRMAVERELSKDEHTNAYYNLLFDESSNFIMYSTPLGIKLINIVTNKLVKLLGLPENTERFTKIALYQGKNIGSVTTTDFDLNAKEDPTLFCTAYKKNRFYLFTRREPADDHEGYGRDVFNEKPSEDERTAVTQAAVLPTEVILRTTMGDIHLKLHADKFVFHFPWSFVLTIYLTNHRPFFK